MKTQYVRELAAGERVATVLSITARELRTGRDGTPYLRYILADKTGRIPGVLFEPDTEAMAIPVGAVVAVAGIATTYRGKRRVRIDSITPGEAESTDLIASGPVDLAEVRTELRRLVDSVATAELRRVLRAVFGDRPFLARFMASPGAHSHHHAYVGGLAEHTVAVARICELLADLYPHVDRDLLITSALLHDVGKVDELECGSSIGYTTEGRLVGHVVLGERRMQAAVAEHGVRVAGRTLTLLSHAMLSHHGELEWGAPKRPSTLEALLLHHADNMDAKATGFADLTAHAAAVSEQWTDAHNLFRRPLHAPMAVEDEPRVCTEDDSLVGAMGA
jgi:3'-5' exoribonuclease